MRLGDSVFGTRHLGGVTGDEVEHGLGRVKLGDWWKDTTGIAGKKNDIAGVVGGQARDLGVRNVFNRIGASFELILLMNFGGGGDT